MILRHTSTEIIKMSNKATEEEKEGVKEPSEEKVFVISLHKQVGFKRFTLVTNVCFYFDRISRVIIDEHHCQRFELLFCGLFLLEWVWD